MSAADDGLGQVVGDAVDDGVDLVELRRRRPRPASARSTAAGSRCSAPGRPGSRRTRQSARRPLAGLDALPVRAAPASDRPKNSMPWRRAPAAAAPRPARGCASAAVAIGRVRELDHQVALGHAALGQVGARPSCAAGAGRSAPGGRAGRADPVADEGLARGGGDQVQLVLVVVVPARQRRRKAVRQAAHEARRRPAPRSPARRARVVVLQLGLGAGGAAGGHGATRVVYVVEDRTLPRRRLRPDALLTNKADTRAMAARSGTDQPRVAGQRTPQRAGRRRTRPPGRPPRRSRAPPPGPWPGPGRCRGSARGASAAGRPGTAPAASPRWRSVSPRASRSRMVGAMKPGILREAVHRHALVGVARWPGCRSGRAPRRGRPPGRSGWVLRRSARDHVVGDVVVAQAGGSPGRACLRGCRCSPTSVPAQAMQLCVALSRRILASS